MISFPLLFTFLIDLLWIRGRGMEVKQKLCPFSSVVCYCASVSAVFCRLLLLLLLLLSSSSGDGDGDGDGFYQIAEPTPLRVYKIGLQVSQNSRAYPSPHKTSLLDLNLTYLHLT